MNPFKKVFSNQELRKKIIYTIILLIIVRVGAFIPVPGINGDLAVEYFKYATKGSQNLLQLVDVFSGGAFAQMTVIALGIMPYITASIVVQLLVALVPSIQREVKENQEAGKRKLGKWTRILTLFLSFFQSGLLCKFALQMNLARPGIVASEMLSFNLLGIPWLFFIVVMFSMTTGTLLLMWVGEQITEKGIGNGISLIITIGILSQIPSAIGLIFSQLNLDSQDIGQLTIPTLIVLGGVFVFVIVGTILVIQGQRKVPLQYARRTVSHKETPDSGAHIPLKLNYAGVIPVIFASSLLMFPATIGQFMGTDTWIGSIAASLSPGKTAYTVVFISLIIFFTYFWTSTQFHPEQIASDMKRNGAFIPGIRQGKPTQDYLESTMNRITLLGALSLAIIAILPTLVSKFLKVDWTISHFFGGTSLLILVGVVLDTMQQIDSHLLMKKYDGYMKNIRVKNR